MEPSADTAAYSGFKAAADPCSAADRTPGTLSSSSVRGADPSIYTDQVAEPDPAMPATGWACTGPGGPLPFHFNYVFNAELDDANAKVRRRNLRTLSGEKALHIGDLPDAGNAILMLEVRASRDELPVTEPFYGESLDRHQFDWQRFAARHQGGGHLAFANGHAAWASNLDITTPGIDAVTGPPYASNRRDAI